MNAVCATGPARFTIVGAFPSRMAIVIAMEHPMPMMMAYAMI